MTRQEKARKQLLRLLSQSSLETLSGRDSPWHADKATLLADVLAKWPHDEIAEIIERLIEDAKP